MTLTLRLAIESILFGAVLGLLVLAAAAAAGRTRKLPFWLSGTAWGIITSGLALSDCLHKAGSGPVSDAAFPVFFGGLLLFPVLLVWRQPYWFLRWILAQSVLVLCIGPAFLVAVIGAMCTLS